MPKLYIFDQDGTLYPKDGPLYRATSATTKEWVRRRLNIGGFGLEELYRKLEIEQPNSLDGFASLGLTVEDYHASVFDIINVANFLDKDQRLRDLLI